MYGEKFVLTVDIDGNPDFLASILKSVADLYIAAGAAYNELAELTLQLHQITASPSGSQTRTPLKKKAFVEAGHPVRQTVTTQSQQGMLVKSSEVTLNMLNAQESEGDAEGMHDVKMEFGTGSEDVTP